MFQDRSGLSVQHSPDPHESFRDVSPMGGKTVGKARFETPGPDQPKNVQDDTIRYIKKRVGDKKESIGEYVEGSRQMLQLNIGIMNKQHEIIKLRDMIQDEDLEISEKFCDSS